MTDYRNQVIGSQVSSEEIEQHIRNAHRLHSEAVAYATSRLVTLVRDGSHRFGVLVRNTFARLADQGLIGRAASSMD